jgi:hypothetical protein
MKRMKRTIIYCFSAILALSFFSCETNTPEDDITNPDPKPEVPVSVEIQGEATMSQFIEGGAVSTYASVNGNQVAWGNSDKFRLYDEVGSGEGRKVSDTSMSFGRTEGAATATFTGWVANVEGSRKFYAVYPLGTSNAELDRFPLSITRDQRYDDAIAGKYLASIASAAFTGNPGEENPLSFQFRHVVALWNINITNAEEKSIKSVKVMVDPDGPDSAQEPFLIGGTIDLKQDYSNDEVLRVDPLTYASYVSTAFSSEQTASTVSAGLYLLPSTVTGDLKISVSVDDNGDNVVLNFPLPDFNQEFVSGTLYTLDIDLDDAEEEEEPVIEDPNFTIENGVVIAYTGPGGEITIPAHATSIADGANANVGVFKDNASITKVNLNNVVTVGKFAFKGCANITEVDAPNLEILKDEGFHALSSLTTINAPKLKTIAAHGFRSCTSLTSLDLSSVTSLTGQNNFRSCSALESIDLSSCEGIIPFQAFMQCTKLATVIIPKVTSIGGTDMGTGGSRGQVFADCSELTSLDLPEVTTLSWRAINASSLTTLNAPKVTHLAPQAMGYCTALRYVSFPSLVEIGNNAFNQGNGAEMTIDLSEATGLTAVGTNVIPDIAIVKIYVATQEIKDLFPTYPNATVTVGTPPAQ